MCKHVQQTSAAAAALDITVRQDISKACHCRHTHSLHVKMTRQDWATVDSLLLAPALIMAGCSQLLLRVCVSGTL